MRVGVGVGAEDCWEPGACQCQEHVSVGWLQVWLKASMAMVHVLAASQHNTVHSEVSKTVKEDDWG